MVDACIHIILNIDFNDVKGIDKEIRNTHINIGCGEDLTISDLAIIIKDIVGFKGNLNWDSSEADGTMQQLLDVGKLHQLGWKNRISLQNGIKAIYSNCIS